MAENCEEICQDYEKLKDVLSKLHQIDEMCGFNIPDTDMTLDANVNWMMHHKDVDTAVKIIDAVYDVIRNRKRLSMMYSTGEGREKLSKLQSEYKDCVVKLQEADIKLRNDFEDIVLTYFWTENKKHNWELCMYTDRSFEAVLHSEDNDYWRAKLGFDYNEDGTVKICAKYAPYDDEYIREYISTMNRLYDGAETEKEVKQKVKDICESYLAIKRRVEELEKHILW